MKARVTAAVVAGGFALGVAVLGISTLPSTASAQENSESTNGADSDRPNHRHGAVLEEVLADLVAAGTIDQDQADAVLEAVVAKADEIAAQRQELRELIRQFLEDDVITADELSQLPDVHPFNNTEGVFSEALADGELTRAEIADARPHHRGSAFKRGARFGAILDDGGIDQSEYDALDDDHPLKQTDVSQYLDDGVITIDELREIRQSQSKSGDNA